LRVAIREALDRVGREYPEYLPARLQADEHLAAIGDALEEAHYPASFEGRDAALQRMAFDELLALQVGMVGRRRQRGHDAARPLEVADTVDAELRAALRGSIARKLEREVSLTPDQDGAIADIRGDLGRATAL